MDELLRPEEISPEDWVATPAGVRTFILTLVPLREQVALLEARLNQHAQNSSKPPSTDPPSAPARPAKVARGKPKTKGAQPGHPNPQRELLPPAQVDQIVPFHPTQCPCCQAVLASTHPDAVPPRRQQVWELPEIRPSVTEYQYRTVACPDCGSLVTAPRPPEVPPGAFGPQVVAMVAALHGRFRLSNRELAEWCAQGYQLPISVGSVAHLQQVASAALAPAYGEVQQVVRAQPQTNADETSWRQEAKRAWLWVAVTAVATLFLVHASRGAKACTALLGADYAGIVGSDRYRVYNGIPADRRQLCWAHLVRNLRGLADHHRPWSRPASDLLALTEVLFGLWQRFGTHQIDRPLLQAALLPIQQAMWEIVTTGQHETNAFGSFCQDVLPRWDALWTFASVDGVEPTNNVAERALRPAVLWRKGCFGTQCAAGSRFVERMLTVSATCRQQERPLLPYLTAAVTAYWAGQPAPVLIPADTP